MARMNWISAAVLAALVVALPAHAQWKWKDKTGRVQYSDLPPPAGTAEQDILQRPGGASRMPAPAAAPATPSAAPAPGTAASGGGLAPQQVEPELEAKRRQAEEEQAAKKKQQDQKVAAQRADNCARAKTYMKSIEEGTRLSRTNAQGEREILDDKGREEEAKRTRGVIASDCK